MSLNHRADEPLGLWQALWTYRRLSREALRLQLGLARLQVILPAQGEAGEAGYGSAVTDLGLHPRRIQLVLSRHASGDSYDSSTAGPRVTMDLLTRPGACLPVLLHTDFVSTARARAADRSVSCQLFCGRSIGRSAAGAIRLSLYEGGAERDRLEVWLPEAVWP